jgi:hypothetical protein
MKGDMKNGVPGKTNEVLFDPTLPKAGGYIDDQLIVVGVRGMGALENPDQASKDTLSQLTLTVIHEGIHLEDIRAGWAELKPTIKNKYSSLFTETHAFTAEIEFATGNGITGLLEGEFAVRTIRDVVSSVLTKYPGINTWLIAHNKPGSGNDNSGVEEEVIRKVHSLIPAVPTGLK